MVVIVLWLAVLTSAVYLVKVRYDARMQFIELQKEIKKRDVLATEWTQLQIEQSSLASHARIDRVARDQLKLKQPNAKDVVILHDKNQQKKQ